MVCRTPDLPGPSRSQFQVSKIRGQLPFPDDQADCVRRDFPELADLAWKALQKVTSPHVTTVDGKPMRRYRVGPAAKAWALQQPGRVLRDGGLLLKIKDDR